MSSAVISDDGLYRYRLERSWGRRPPLTWVLLNPSTADAERDDATVRRCVGFATRDGYGGIVVVNLFALRVSRPAHLFDGSIDEDPNGPENGRYVQEAMRGAYNVAVGWGADVRVFRSTALAEVMRRPRLLCLGKNKDGTPHHPLYLAGATRFEAWP